MINDPASFVASGAADIAVSIYPRWNAADEFDYSLRYLMRRPSAGPRELAHHRLSGHACTNWIIGYFADDPDGEAQIMKYAEFFNVGKTCAHSDYANPMRLHHDRRDNISAIFGDSRLQALMREAIRRP